MKMKPRKAQPGDARRLAHVPGQARDDPGRGDVHAGRRRDAAHHAEIVGRIAPPQHVLQHRGGEGQADGLGDAGGDAAQIGDLLGERIGPIVGQAEIARADRAHHGGDQAADHRPGQAHGQQELQAPLAVAAGPRLQHQDRLQHQEPQRVAEADQIGDGRVAEHGLQVAPGIDPEMQRAIPRGERGIEIERMHQRNDRLEIGEAAGGDRPQRQHRQRQQQPLAAQEIGADALPRHRLEVLHLADARIVEIPEREGPETGHPRHREEPDIGRQDVLVRRDRDLDLAVDQHRGEAIDEDEQDERAVLAQGGDEAVPQQPAGAGC